ncbi:unnamed protein product [Oikopleura dioica]|uniref:Protein kinase domain-containing protein n=1 Tax=Oikopleura dioica TaxID=34765 RepID=E4YDA8_OIKDI|nr:unnamed protein product [Oikopleura dioica]
MTDNEVSELSFIVEHDGRIEKFSFLYPVIYQDFYREVQKKFKLEELTRLILHYEHLDNVFRPISFVDFETLINFRIHWNECDDIIIKITVDDTSPPTQTARHNFSLPFRYENELISQRNGYFIPEDVDDPILAPIATKRSPLSSHESDRFIQEPPDVSDDLSENDVSIEDSEWEKNYILKLLAELLGKGGFGRVYAAICQETNKRLAVKVVDTNREDDAEIQHIFEEIDTLRALSHRNIIQFISCGKDENTVYVFMELMEGGTIHTYLKKYGKMDEVLAKMYTKQVLCGLEYLHSLPIAHRDVKGSNILLDATLSLVKLADFGAAKKLNFIDKSRYDHSKKGDIVGTPYWMAPEVVRGHGCGRRSDIWSAGCTILEMLTLKPPFKNFEPLAALFHIASATSPAQIFDSGSFSPNLTDLLYSIFVPVNERPLASFCLNHSWFSQSNQS